MLFRPQNRSTYLKKNLVGETSSRSCDNPDLCRVIRLCCAVLLFLIAVIPAISFAQTKISKPAWVDPIPEPAMPAILAAFDKYEVVAMPEAHGMKDLDDFIFSLIRNPAFSEKVNDIEVECGNSLYQPVLDRYIAGDDVPFTDVRKVWRNTTASMCGMSGFFEQFFPLVRVINRKLPSEKRLRVLAGDSPIDWDQVKNFEDILRVARRDTNIASVMEKEVLAKHRKALMLFGTFHLLHGQENAVSIYEKDFPNLTFVISDLGIFDTDLPTLSSSPFASWPIPSVARAKGTWLGALDLSHFLPPGTRINKDDCSVHNDFPRSLQRPMEDLVDAFLYLGPQDLRLWEQFPADIALDVDYRMELRRRDSLPGLPAAPLVTLKESDQQIVNGAEHPLLAIPKQPPDSKAIKAAVQSCLELKDRNRTPQ
jgi:hypothetical protein